MSRVFSLALGLYFFMCGSGLAQQINPQDLFIRNKLVSAFTSTSAHEQQAKLKEVLTKDPENYYALIKLGELELHRDAKGDLAANEYFLRAALSQPHRPEAYLCLAHQCYLTGYVPEGANHMMKALKGPHTKLSYEAVCLQAQNYLDRCNYQAAMMLYGYAALSDTSPFADDSHLVRKLYQAAVLAPAPALWVWDEKGKDKGGNFTDHLQPEPWVPYIFAKLVGISDKEYPEFLKRLRKVAEEIRNMDPRFTPRASEMLINMSLHKHVLSRLRQRVGPKVAIESISSERYTLSKDFFSFGICPNEKIRKLDADLDLYEVFLEASVPNQGQRRELVRELKQKKDEALEAIAKIQDPREKGRELFRWLRENLIKTYDAVDGVTAEGAIKNQKYLCLTGAIIYTLFGRDAGLKVDGVIEPGHAYAVLHDAKGQKVNVQTTFPVKATAMAPAGFDAPGKLPASEEGDLRAVPDICGEVSAVDLVAYQFTNVGLNKLDHLTVNKYGSDLRAVLEKEGLNRSKVEQFIDAWRKAVPGVPKYKVMALISERNPEYHARLSEQIDGLLDSFQKGRAFCPLNSEFLSQIEGCARLVTELAVHSPGSSMAKRLKNARDRDRNKARESVEQDMRRQAKTTEGAGTEDSTASSSSTAADSEDKERIKWSQEKKVWLDSLKRLEKLVDNYPCNASLRATLGEHAINVAKVLTVAKVLNLSGGGRSQLPYQDLIDELNRINAQHFSEAPIISETLSASLSQL